jgi:hypothetical protein
MISRDSILAIREDIPDLTARCSMLRVLNCPKKGEKFDDHLSRYAPLRMTENFVDEWMNDFRTLLLIKTGFACSG